ncbi:MAG TPA: hypothetical protein VFO49_08710 [Nocardioides sp.]|nr:hypothetical protein [Nocardioides sp.]
MGRLSWLMVLVLVAGCSGGTQDDDDAAPSPSPSPLQLTPVDATDLDGTIAYSTVLDESSSDDVFVLELDGGHGEPLRLTDGPAKEFDPALSPDGAQIAYRVNQRADSDEADIWVMRVDGTGRRNLTRSPEDLNWAPTWSADGRIVYASQRGSPGQPRLWSMAADGSDRRLIGEGWCEYAAPSPDGRYVCSSSSGGAYDLVVVDEDGEREGLTSTPESEFGASWSPDGEWIVFSRDTGGRWELLRIRPDGSDEQVVAAEGVYATWSPDGLLAWTGPGGISVANPDGSGRTTVEQAADFLSWRR